MDKNIRVLERQAATGDPSAVERLNRARERANMLPDMTIEIDGDRHKVVTISLNWAPDGMAAVETYEGKEFYLAPDSESAGKAARARWAEMAADDPTEFRHMVGDETLVKWALGQSAGPGNTAVRSLTEWLDLWISTPEEEWAGYDGSEAEVDRVSADVTARIGFTPTVAYRYN
jgi:hypothetical protein